jgi:hypothetical protein
MTIILQEFPIGKFIGSMLTLWGAILMFTTLAKNFAGMMVLRFILGERQQDSFISLLPLTIE